MQYAICILHIISLILISITSDNPLFSMYLLIRAYPYLSMYQKIHGYLYFRKQGNIQYDLSI